MNDTQIDLILTRIVEEWKMGALHRHELKYKLLQIVEEIEKDME